VPTSFGASSANDAVVGVSYGENNEHGQVVAETGDANTTVCSNDAKTNATSTGMPIRRDVHLFQTRTIALIRPPSVIVTVSALERKIFQAQDK
jgi:hypothetical protein